LTEFGADKNLSAFPGLGGNEHTAAGTKAWSIMVSSPENEGLRRPADLASGEEGTEPLRAPGERGTEPTRERTGRAQREGREETPTPISREEEWFKEGYDGVKEPAAGKEPIVEPGVRGRKLGARWALEGE
jgi:hypothetical protein